MSVFAHHKKHTNNAPSHVLDIHERMNHAVEESDKLQPGRLATYRLPHDERDPSVVIYLQKACLLSFENQNPVENKWKCQNELGYHTMRK